MRLFLADLCAATMSTLLMFGLGYYFTAWIKGHAEQAQRYAILAAGVGVAGFLLYRHYKAQKRGGRPVGPPVPVTDVVPVPVDDLHSGIVKMASLSPPIPPPRDPPPDVIRIDTVSASPPPQETTPALTSAEAVVSISPEEDRPGSTTATRA